MFNIEAFNRAVARTKDKQAKQHAHTTNSRHHSNESNEHADATVKQSTEEYQTTLLDKMRERLSQSKEK